MEPENMSVARRRFLQAGLGGLGSMAVAAEGAPNIVILLADDLGWKDVSYQGGPIQTPNIDRIAAAGVRFSQFYGCPLCTPSRASLMTARSPMRYGLVYSVLRPWSPYGLPLDERTLPETFRAAGYQTAMIGKWHLGHARRKHLPQARGFDYFYGCVNAEIDYFKHTHQLYGGIDWQRNGTSVHEEGYSTDLMAADAVRVIEKRQANKPLLLYVAFNAPHGPVQAPDALVAKYGNIADPRRRNYWAAVDAMDTGIGRILDALDRAGMTQNTIVLFTSDNGGAGKNNTPLRDGKLTAYEGGIRVPAALRWPARLNPGESHQVFTNLDVLPTLAAAVGVKPVAGKPLDGEDVWPQITARTTRPRGSLYFACKQNEGEVYQFGVRRGEWKLVRHVRDFNVVGQELYNVEEDVQEKTDLASRSPERVKDLSKELDDWKALHPRCDVDSSLRPHPGWIVPEDYAAAAL